MKRIALFLGIMLVVGSIHAQDIFKNHGFDKEILTLSKGKYKEVFANDKIVQIGTVLLNTENNEIVKFLEEDNSELSYTAEHSSRFLTVDPLAERFPWQSPYAYCSNNPVNRIDPSGMADFWHNGNVIGNDGIDDSKIYVIKTTEKSFGNTEDGSLVNGAGLSKKDQKATLNFIKNNSGNTEAFQNNGIAYTNSIGIESSSSARQDMVNEISRDNGRGGTGDANNREYGGSISNGVVTLAEPGPVSSPGNSASISLPTGKSTFHSHPSGESTSNSASSGMSIGAVSSYGGTTTTRGYHQTPSPTDIQNAGSHTNYVFGRSKTNNNVYIYNSSGVQAVIPMKHFVNPKR